jgi:hypothetical protein
LLHAFARSGKVLMRETPETKRYPLIGPLVGLSVPQAVGQRTEVLPKVEAAIQTDISVELPRLIQQVLAGNIPVDR